MSQSLANILVHLIFSTKHREPWIHDEIRSPLNAYVVGILANHQSPSVAANSVQDHMHILFSLSKNYSVAKIVEEVKTDSSRWMKEQGVHGFRWQNGYGAFSIGQSQVAAVKKYIAGQEEHHRRVSFQEEFRRFLERYQVKYDERYVWD
ncbi:MAG: IS200/IS605 family transposase [Terriglobia bacterium]